MVLRTNFQKAVIINISIVILIFVAYANSYAAKHYVDSAANGSNDGTSWENAWQGPSKIDWSKVNAGDTIYISGGSTKQTYTSGYLNINAKSGSAGNPITITKGVDPGHNGEVVFDSNFQEPYGFYIAQDHIVISHITVKRTNPPSDRGAVYVTSSANNIVVDKCKIYHPRKRGFYISGGPMTISNTYIDSEVQNYNAECDNIFVWYGNNITVDNVEAHLRSYGTSYHNDVIQFFGDNLTVKNSWLQWHAGYGNSASQTTIAQDWDTIVFYNNIIIGNEASRYNGGLYIGYNSRNGNESIKIANNTIIGQHPQAYAMHLACDADDIDMVVNNIIYTEGGPCTYFDNGTDGKSWVSNNICSHNLSSLLLDTNYAPKSINSPAVDQGADLSNSSLAFSRDKENKARPIGAAWDVGAVEYGEAVDAPNKPDPPTNLRILNN